MHVGNRRMSRWESAVTGLAFTALIAAGSLAHGQAIEESAIPDELRPWVGWVEGRNPQRECVASNDGFLCLWPSELSMRLSDRGGTFRFRVFANARQLLPLPGEARRWPLSVKLDGKPVAVIEHDGGPAAEVARGQHSIEGSFTWNALPETLKVPSATALVSLELNGKTITQPRRDESGQLWLSGGATLEREGEHLELEVFRHVQDGVPLVVTTQLKLKASGRARETLLSNVLVPGTAAYALEANVPARLDPNGTLSLQVRAGSFQVTIVARTEGSPDRLAPPRAEAPWPTQETWVFQADENVRQVRLGGAAGVDPAQTNLPPEWQQLPAFVLGTESALAFETTRRGQPEPPPNQLNLRREMWLDLDGTGYTVRDALSGELHSTWRLALPAGDLGHVRADDGDQLITVLDKNSGVEVRKSRVALTAEWRTEQARGQLPAVGWSEDVQSLSTTLHLPPGWDVFAVEGVDHVSNTWLEGWDLFHFFFVLMVALGAGRMFGPITGLVALVTLVLCHQQDDAPETVWLVLLGVLALLRVITEGKWNTVMRSILVGALLSFVAVAAPFAITQVRQAIYPQIGYSDYSGYDHHDEEGGMGRVRNMIQGELEEEAPEPMMAPSAPMPVETQEDARMGGSARGGSLAEVLAGDSLVALDSDGYGKDRAAAKSVQRKQLQDRDPNAVVQTGPGIPTRAFRTWQLEWTGPVERGATIQLWLLPPTATSALGLLRVLLIGLLAFLLLRRAPFTPGAGTNARVTTAALIVAVATMLGHGASSAHAQTPSPEVLAELEARLHPEPVCATCLSVTQLDLNAKDNRLRMVVEVHAGTHVVYRLPGPAQTWVPDTVTVDGRDDAALALGNSGFLLLRLPAGTHRVEMSGALAQVDSITLSLGDPPRRVTASAEGWDIAGVHEDATTEDSVQLSRAIAPDPSGEPQRQANTLPPWLEVTRSLELGVTWHVTTTVHRVSPTGAAVLVRVPLLAGESVTDANLQVENGHALVTLGRDATELSWTSTLAQIETLSLEAPSRQPWSEQWLVQCGRVFHCSVEGTQPVRHTAEGLWWPAFRPWPGEKLTIHTARPNGAEGQSTTIDRVDLTVAPGVRMRRTTLALELRSSTGGIRTLHLPKDARIQSTTVDGERVPVRFNDGQLGVSVARGKHDVVVEWQEPLAMTTADATPSVAVGGPATNVTLNFVVPDERWLLFVSGPSWGPAILFWGTLLAMILLSVGLSRVPHSPLRATQWVLLTVGLTQVDTMAQLVIAGWFFVLAYRARRPIQGPWMHNLGQLILVGWTFTTLGCLYWALHSGLLFPPNMQVASSGFGDSQLNWYVDRVSGALPTAHVVSVSIWVWRVAMLAWALWLAWSLLNWLPWAWRSFTTGGGWKPMGRAPAKVSATAPATTAASTATATSPTTPEAAAPSTPPTNPSDRE